MARSARGTTERWPWPSSRRSGCLRATWRYPALLKPLNPVHLVGIDRRSRGDVSPREGHHGWAAEVGDHFHPDASRRLAAPLDRDHRERRPAAFQLAASAEPGLRPADPRLVDLDLAMEQLTNRVHHRSAQLVEHHPGCLIAPQPELALQEQGREAALVRGDQVCRPEPRRQRLLGVVQDRARSHRDLVAAGHALPPPTRHQGERPTIAAAGAVKAVRPSAGCEVPLAGVVFRELALELTESAGERRAWHAPPLRPDAS